MRFQTPLVVVVGLLLGLAALDRWGELVEGSTPTWLRAPDTVRKEAVLWEGVATPLVEGKVRESPESREKEGTAPRGTTMGALLGRLSGREAAALVGRGPLGATVGPARPLDPQVFPVVSIGQPEIWRLPDLYPPQKMPLLMQAQLQEADFYLIRLFCSFRPIPGQARVGWARFHVFLPPDIQGRQPIAYDISPVDITQEVKRHLKFTLAPTLKFRTVVEAEVGGLEFGLEYPELQPIIVGAGVGEAMPTWDYQVATGMAGIQGAKWMHLLVKAPKGMPAATAQLALTAQLYVESRASWIPIVGGPTEQGARLDVPLWPRPSSP